MTSFSKLLTGETIMALKIKDIRRIETEMDKEISLLQSSFTRNVSDNVEETSEKALRAGKSLVEMQRDELAQFLETKFNLRQIVANHNSSTKINDNCIKIAKLEFELNLIENTVMNVSGVAVKQEYTSKGYVAAGYKSGVDVEFKNQLRVEARKVRREIQRLKDSCNGINGQSEYELIPNDLEFLKSRGFLD